MIRLTGVTFTYRNATAPTLSGLDAALENGRIHGLIGANGAGKSTLFGLLMGLSRPTAGRVEVDAPADRRVLVPQTVTAPWSLKAAEVRDLILALNGTFSGEARDRFMAGMTGEERQRFERIAGRRFGQLSNGERAWLLCALILFRDSDLYLLDEPTVGIDPEFRHLVWSRINARVAEGRTIVVSSHVLEEIGARVDDLFLLANGRLQRFESLEQMVATYGGRTVDETFRAAVNAVRG